MARQNKPGIKVAGLRKAQMPYFFLERWPGNTPSRQLCQ
jgi:hypothetical protein